jgi:hypothetical protein
MRKGTLTVVTLLAVLTMPAASRAAVRPSVRWWRVSPTQLGPAGGWFTIEGSFRNAVSCTLEGGAGRKRTFNCRSGHVRIREYAHANRGRYPEVYFPHMELHNGHFNKRTRDAQVEVASAVPAAPAVVNLDACEPGPECDYGFAYEQFKTWGNAAGEALGDCTFAAAANWEQVIMRRIPYEADLGYEFAQAGGTANGGLSMTKLFSYWQKYGIAGMKLTAFERFATDKTNVVNAVRTYKALIVSLAFGEGYGFGQYTMNGGNHATLVIGFTPDGPLVASWGETLQMTWAQWEAEVRGLWALETTSPST